MTNKTFKGYQLIKDSTGGSGPLRLVFIERRVAELEADARKGEWEQYFVKEVDVREISKFEGIVDGFLVIIDHTSLRDILRRNAARKLTEEERDAVGLL